MKLSTRPSLREKKRYIIFRVHSEEPIDYSNLKNAISNSLTNWLGEKELAKAEVKIIRNLWDRKNQTGFIKCSVGYVDEVKMSLALIHQIGDDRVVFQTMRVSGTIKSGKMKTSFGNKFAKPKNNKNK